MTPLPSEFLQRPIAHRALHDTARGRPENSCAAISAAIAQGFGIEIDVQLTSDGQAMVFHDYDLERMTGRSGPLVLETAASLAQISLIGSPERIPMLTEVLALVAGRVPVLLEIKDEDRRMGPRVGRLEQAVALALSTYDGPVAVMSFNPHSVEALGRLAPNLPRGLTTGRYRWRKWPVPRRAIRKTLRQIPDYERLGCNFISHDVRDLSNRRVAELKTKGAPVLCWTVRSAAQEAKARRIADNVTFEGYIPFSAAR